MFRGHQKFGGLRRESNKISFMIFSQVLYCNGGRRQNFCSRKHSAKMYSQRLETNFKLIKTLHKNLNNSPNYIKNKIIYNLILFKKYINYLTKFKTCFKKFKEIFNYFSEHVEIINK